MSFVSGLESIGSLFVDFLEFVILEVEDVVVLGLRVTFLGTCVPFALFDGRGDLESVLWDQPSVHLFLVVALLFAVLFHVLLLIVVLLIRGRLR